RPGLLEVALKTAVDAVHASGGRVVASASREAPVADIGVIGSLAGFERQIQDAEQAALQNGSIGESRAGQLFLASVVLRPVLPPGTAVTSCPSSGLALRSRAH